MKGRKPKLSVIEGGADIGRCPSSPAWLPDHAKREWRRVAPILHERGLLSDDTMAVLESYCIAVSTVRENQEVIGRDRDLFGQPTKTAATATKLMFAAMREARLLAAELGLTPYRRGGKEKTDGKKPNDEWDTDLLA